MTDHPPPSGGTAGAGRTIVICSDGTGNTFDSRITNVTRLVRLLALDRPERQLVVYDQGLGTTAGRQRTVQQQAAAPALRILPAPSGSRRPSAVLNRGRALLFGTGLRDNVRQLYGALTEVYSGPSDAVYFFGFSRGAFTVRALAGLLYRCWLPQPGVAEDSFARAWELFQSMDADRVAVASLRRGHRPCPIHFLGVWDTVKSYGGLDPVILPHLRHNPAVAHIRHALALDERRAWFKPTTWGQLDSDRDGAMTRLDPDDTSSYAAQDVREVWFTGCHSDIGTRDHALRWMLAEAVLMQSPLLLDDTGKSFLRVGDPAGPPTIDPSWTWYWRIIEQVRRMEIDNSGVYPVKVAHRGSDGVRDPRAARRRGTVLVHASAGPLRFADEVEVVSTSAS